MKTITRCALVIGLSCAATAYADDPVNLMPNGSFNDTAGSLGWTFSGPGSASFDPQVDADNNPASGSLLLRTTGVDATPEQAISACFKVNPGAAYQYGAKFGGGGEPTAGGMICNAFSDTACQQATRSLGNFVPIPLGEWTSLFPNSGILQNERSVQCYASMYLSFPMAQPGGGRMDDVYFNSTTPSPSPVKLDGYMSGNWYDVQQPGHGFQLEFTDQQNTLLAIWFGFDPDGSGSRWIFAQGPYDPNSNSVTVPAFMLDGVAFPPSQFDGSALKRINWGTLTFNFSDCDTGTASWISLVPSYGVGELPIKRLTSIKGTTCPR